MTIPNLALAVEPFESGKVVFLPMSPLTSKEKARGRIILRLSITNHEAASVTVLSVKVSFPNSSVPAETKSINMSVAHNATTLWWFQNPSDDILFDLPGPSQIKLEFKVSGFTEDKAFTFPLAPHTSPVSGGAYLFPAKAVDLGFGEFWTMNGCTHGMGNEGSQSFAYDMGVWGVDPETDVFDWKKPGKDGTKNDHMRVFGKQLYAMADGVVRHFLNVCPNNPVPLSWSSDAELKQKSQAQRDNFWGSFEDSGDHGGAGNHFYIQHGDEVVLYAHMQKGTLNPQLLTVGANVTAGDFLGLAGNSGSSSGPHTHIHAIQGTAAEVGPLRPILIKDSWVIDNDLIVNQPQKGFWAKMDKKGMPEGSSIDWWKGDVFLSPSAKLPEYPEIVKFNVAESSYQALANDMFNKGFRPVSIQAYSLLNSLTFFNVIFRPFTGVLWQSRHGLDGNQYQAEYDLWVEQNNYRIANVVTYWSHSKGKVVYAVLFEKTSGPTQAAYHGLTKAQHQAKLDDWTSAAKGYVPTQISVASAGGERWYTGVYEKKNIAGSWELRSTLSPEEYQQKWNDNVAAKRGLAWVHTYLHQGKINFVGLWYGGLSPAGQHHLDITELTAALKNSRKNNLYLRGLSGYDRSGIPNHAAFWSK